MSEGDAGRLVRNSMVEALWVDCDNRAKVGGAANSRCITHTSGTVPVDVPEDVPVVHPRLIFSL